MLVLIVVALCFLSVAAGTSPVILVPGDGGSQLQGRWDKEKTPHFYCANKQKDWYTLWVAVTELAPGIIDCWSDTIVMDFDNDTGTFSNRPGVEIRAPGFGGTDTVEYLDPDLKSATKYFYGIAQTLTTVGLKRGVTIRGAPYDFRLAVHSNKAWLANMTDLIEETYKNSGNTPVTIVAHSMGCLYSLYYLHQMPQSWKDTFIHAFIPISGPWTGTVSQLRLFASGSADLVPGHLIRPLSVRKEQRSWESNAWLLPVAGVDSNHTWSKSDIIVTTATRNYTAHDMHSFFSDIQFAVGSAMYDEVRPHNVVMQSPGVKTHCLYGTDVKTEAAYKYPAGSWPDKQPDKVYGVGDGTVNRRSLTACQGWATGFHEFPNVGHTEMLTNADVFSMIKQIVAV